MHGIREGGRRLAALWLVFWRFIRRFAGGAMAGFRWAGYRLIYHVMAYGDLLGRYRDMVRYHWGERKSLEGGRFKDHEAEFLPAALSLLERPVSRTARLTAQMIVGGGALALAWSIVGKMDVIVTATGKVVPSSRTKAIASIEVARVKAVHVEDGQLVHAGDTLVELDTGASEMEQAKARETKEIARLQMARSRAIVNAIDRISASPRLPPAAAFQLPALPKTDGFTDARYDMARSYLMGQWDEFISKLTRANGEIARYGEQLDYARRKAESLKVLSENHDVSVTSWLEAEQQRVDVEGKLTDAANVRLGVIAEMRRQAWESLTEGEKTSAVAAQDELRAAGHREQLRLTSPVDGIVQQLSLHTVGGVVPAAQPLMFIVPVNDAVEVEAAVENKDIGFIHVGQEAAVKVVAYDYARYGLISGRIKHISRDSTSVGAAVPEVKAEDAKSKPASSTYAVEIVLLQSKLLVDGKWMSLQPGMSVSVDIKTGRRRIIEYVLSPIMRTANESLNER